MAIRNVLVHLDGPEAIGGLPPEVERFAIDLGVPRLTVVVLSHVAVPITGASLALALVQARARDMPACWLLGFRIDLPAGLVASAIWLLIIPLSLGPQT